MIRTMCQRVRELAAVSGAVALLSLAGCQGTAAEVSLDSAAQSLVQFVGDFARQVLAAYLF